MAWSSSNRQHRLPGNWKTLRLQILVRDNYDCKIRDYGCLREAREVDHIRPGDDHAPSNLRAACTVCHRRKSALEGVAGRRQKAALRRRPPERHPGEILAENQRKARSSPPDEMDNR